MFAIASLLGLLTACVGPGVESETIHLTSSFVRFETNSIPPDIKTLEVVNRHGDLTIIGSDEDAQSVWRLEARATTDALAEEAAIEAACRIERSGDLFRVIVSLPEDDRHRSYCSDLTIRVPKWVSVVSQNRMGKTRISDLTGSVDATGEHGDMTLRSLPGTVKAKTSFGELTAADCGPAMLSNQHGRIDAQNVNGALDAGTRFGALNVRQIGGAATLRNQHGSVDVAGVDGNCDVWTTFGSLGARNVSGRATLRNEHGAIKAEEIQGTVEARTSFGDIEVSGDGPEFLCRNQHAAIRVRATQAVTKIDAQTSFGLLEVQLPNEFEPAVHARTSFGEIESDLPVLMKPRSADPFEGVPAEKARILLRNQHGDVRIRQG